MTSEQRSDLRAARKETLAIFNENPHGPDWPARLIQALRVEDAIAAGRQPLRRAA